jgi:RHS repeat-associated protein
MRLTYHPTTGLLTQTVIGNLTETFTYNDKGELATHVASYSGSPVYSGTFHSAAAPRDNLGRITQKAETVNGVTRTDDYQYDTRGRLLHVARNGDLVSVYDYDDNGNRLSLTNPSASSVTLGSYDDQDRVTNYGSFEYTFNENGDLTSKYNTATDEETTYEYDARGALLSVVLPNSTVIEYVVDGQGRRVGKKVDGVMVQGFIYKDDLRIAAELDGSENIVAQFVYVDAISHSPDYMLKGGQVFRFVKDQLGSPRVVINATTGAAAQTLEFDEFGKLLSDSAAGFQPFGFAGGLYDRDTTLIRYGVRDYDAQAGRWLSKDPIRFDGGINLFLYANSDPITFVDLTGAGPIEIAKCLANGYSLSECLGYERQLLCKNWGLLCEEDDPPPGPGPTFPSGPPPSPPYCDAPDANDCNANLSYCLASDLNVPTGRYGYNVCRDCWNRCRAEKYWPATTYDGQSCR